MIDGALSPSRDRLTRRQAAVVALVAALVAATIAWLSMDGSGLAKDFSLPWTAARHLLAGRDPYAAMRPTGVYPFNVPFYYPLPAAVLTIPFAALPPTAAGVLFVAVSFAVTAFALARDGRYRPVVLLGFPAVMAATLGQWSPLLLAATLIPALQVVVPVKPTLGAAVFAGRPSRIGLAAAVIIVLVSFGVMPGWVGAWRAAVATAWTTYTPPIRWAGGTGILLLTLLVFWRDRDARLLVVMAIAPQLPLFYDQLLVHSVARTRRDVCVLLATSWIGGLAWAFQGASPAGGEHPARVLILASIYAPAAILVVLRHIRVRDQPTTPPVDAG